MGPWEWFVLFAVCGLIVAAATYWSRSDDSLAYRDAWQESTTAERTEADVRRDIADAKARQAQIQAQFDKQFEQIIAGYPADIPHQTRRTEEDQ